MDRLGWRYLQLVAEDEMVLADAQSEAADRALYADQQSTLAPGGINSGLAASQSSVVALTVDVTQGTAHDQSGQRMRVPNTQTIGVALDHLGATTAVTTSGNSKILSVYLKFARNNYSPIPDGNSVTVNWRSDESFSFVVYQGAEGVTPAASALLSDGILICDITRAYGASTVVNADISVARRQWQFAVAGSPRAIARGTAYDAVKDQLGWYNAHVLGSADKHPAGDLVLAVAQTWKDSSAFAATDVDAGFEEILTTLKSVGSGNSGADKIGIAAIVGASNTLGAGSLYASLTTLKNAYAIEYAGGGAWADGTTNPSTSVEGQLDKVITDLSAQGVSPGAQRIGMHLIGSFAGGNVYTAFGEIAGVTGGNDGAKHVGAEVKGSLLGTTVRGQLDELDTSWGKLARANTWSGAQTVADITASGTTHYKLASRSVTRMQNGLSGLVLAIGGTTSLEFVIPHGAVLTSVSVYVDPGTHVTWPPSTKSAFDVLKVDQTTGIPSSVASATDPATTLIAGNATHAIATASFSDTLDRTTSTYVVQFTNESGANAQACTTLGVAVTYTVTALDDGY